MKIKQYIEHSEKLIKNIDKLVGFDTKEIHAKSYVSEEKVHDVDCFCYRKSLFINTFKKTNIKVVKREPPFVFLLKFFFPEYDSKRTVVAFGRTIYAIPEMTPDLRVHEETHLKQHHYSYVWATVWWIRYIISKKFRFSQELQAFRKQFDYGMKYYDQNKKEEFLVMLAGKLSSKLYGNMITLEEAKFLIRTL